jgi:hypothetical protein
LELSPDVNANELLGRFLTERSYFSQTAVKPKAFEPTKGLTLSVERVDGLNMDQIWELGRTDVIEKMPTPKTLYGVGEIKTSTVLSQKLTVVPDPLPCRHANLLGWPTEKFKQISITQELAAAANIILK